MFALWEHIHNLSHDVSGQHARAGCTIYRLLSNLPMLHGENSADVAKAMRDIISSPSIAIWSTFKYTYTHQEPCVKIRVQMN